MYKRQGQTCSALTRFIVPRNMKETVEPLMKEFIEELKVGDPLDETVDIGPLVNKRAFEKVKADVYKRQVASPSDTVPLFVTV